MSTQAKSSPRERIEIKQGYLKVDDIHHSNAFLTKKEKVVFEDLASSIDDVFAAITGFQIKNKEKKSPDYLPGNGLYIELRKEFTQPKGGPTRSIFIEPRIGINSKNKVLLEELECEIWYVIFAKTHP